MEEIKQIIKNWCGYKCVHCGADLIFEDVGKRSKNSRCPNCVWNDSPYQNQYKALLDIGELVGEIFYMTGAIV